LKDLTNFRVQLKDDYDKKLQRIEEKIEANKNSTNKTFKTMKDDIEQNIELIHSTIQMNSVEANNSMQAMRLEVHTKINDITNDVVTKNEMYEISETLKSIQLLLTTKHKSGDQKMVQDSESVTNKNNQSTPNSFLSILGWGGRNSQNNTPTKTSPPKYIYSDKEGGDDDESMEEEKSVIGMQTRSRSSKQ
jgi:hypothetical protein